MVSILVHLFRSKTNSNLELVNAESMQQDTLLQVLSRLQVRGLEVKVNISGTAAQSATKHMKNIKFNEINSNK